MDSGIHNWVGMMAGKGTSRGQGEKKTWGHGGMARGATGAYADADADGGMVWQVRKRRSSDLAILPNLGLWGRCSHDPEFQTGKA